MVEEWFNNKKKTYYRIWENKEKTKHHWVLFILEGELTGAYHSGSSSSLAEAEKEIKWVIATEIKRMNLL